nr:hypothetical protein KPHV_85720 [Kitasatospora purpeofusca]
MNPKRHPAVTIRPAVHQDTSDFLSLLAPADPTNPAPYAYARLVLATPRGGPLTHGRYLNLIAHAADGTPVGALAGGTPRWLYEHDAVRHDPQLQGALAARLCAIGGLAVHPGHRGTGVGKALLHQAERRCTRAGYGLMALDHTPALKPYFAPLGYTASWGFIMALPAPAPLFGQQVLGSLISAKPLDPQVHWQNVPGLPSPVLCGLLPDTGIRPGSVFAGGQLIEPLH